MISLTTLGGKKFYLNDEQIMTIDINPDTTIKLLNGLHFVVKENVDEVLEKIVDFKNKIMVNKKIL